MVKLPSALRALDRKLLRDLWEMRAQSLAIAAVVAAGVAMFVTYLSNFDSLQQTRDAYYEGSRFADVFASAKRVPASIEARLAAIDGVEVVATRVVADVTLDVPGLDEPATGRLISFPGAIRRRWTTCTCAVGDGRTLDGPTKWWPTRRLWTRITSRLVIALPP